MSAATGMKRKQSARDALIEAGLMDEAKANELDEKRKTLGVPFQQVAVTEGGIESKQVLKALAKAWKTRAIDLTQMEGDKEIVGMIPEAVARRHLAVPFAKEDQVLFVAMTDPRDFFVVEDIHIRTGLEIQGFLSLPTDILTMLDTVYGKGTDQAFNRLLGDIEKKKTEKPGEMPDGIGIELDDGPEKTDISDVDASAPEVEKLVNAVILGALSNKASDIHIEPYEDATGANSCVNIRYRCDGLLRPATFQIPWPYRNAIIAKIKIMSNSMNITERRIPQSGRIQILAKGNPIEFRVEIVPTVYGESVVMRILDRASVRVDIKKLGFLSDTLERFLGLLEGIGGKKNFGLVLVCGPTGSGKSTTLYAALNHANRPDIKILTAENPVEYNIDGIVQVPVNPDVKLGGDKVFNFAAALRSFMRLDPDVIMIGEIRDEETAEIAMEAAMTGHLVFSTIHTNDSCSAVSRIAEMGVPGYIVASTMKAILAQRLSRALCPDCKRQRPMNEQEKATFKEHDVEFPENAEIYEPVGCKTCSDTGYKGRCGIHELLVLNDDVREAALTNISAENIRRVAREKAGLRLMVQDGFMKVLEGKTTISEVLGGAVKKAEDEAAA